MTASQVSRRAVLASLGATAVLTACGGEATGGDPGGPINIWGGVPPENGPQELCDAFMAANPGTTVTYTRFVNDDQGNLKLDTGLQGGADIDIFTSYAMPLLSQRVAGGLALDLTDRVAADSDLATYRADANPIQNFVADGKVYSVPAQTSPNIVLANLSMLEAAGITPPQSWSFEEYRSVAQELSTAGVTGSFNAPFVARTTLGPDSNYTAEGKANFRNPAFRSEIDLQVAMQAEGSAMDMKTILAEKMQVYTQGAFLQGKVAMINSQIFLVRYISDTKEFPHDFKTIALPQPGPSATDAGWNTGAVGDLLSISSKSKNPDLAWKVVQFWMKNAATYMTKGGRLPSLPGQETPETLLATLLGPQADTLYDVASFKKVLFEDDSKLIVDTKFAAAAEISKLQTQFTQEVLLGSRTPDSYIDALTEQADAAIAKAG